MMRKDFHMKELTAEILCVGTEILLGDIVNTNAQYIARELAGMGIDVFHQSVIGDNTARLRESLEECFSRSDILVMTGGLGPTYDDLTKETVAEYFGETMVEDSEARQRIIDFFHSRGSEPTPNNFKQTLVPEHATVFENDSGTAPGLALEKDGKTAILLPGPPFEMKAMFEKSVRPYLMGKTDHILVSRTIHMNGIGESQAEYVLKDIMESYTNPTVAPYAKQGEVQIRLTALAGNREEGFAVIEPVIDLIKERLGQYIFGIDIENQETALVRLLNDKGLKISMAESCTGGLLAKRITDVSGASNVLEISFVTYANEAKEKYLGVKRETLAAHGAVSSEVSIEMAEGVRRVSGADIGVGITGIAGPTGGTPEKPVGLIYISVSTANGTQTYKYLPGHRGLSRDALRYAATQQALRMCLEAARKL